MSIQDTLKPVNGSNGGEAPILWQHPNPSSTNLARFMRHVGQKTRPDLTLDSYEALYQWSIDDIAGFWGAVWEFCGVKASKPYEHVLSSSSPPMFPRPDFFAGARLNFAENLLFPAGEWVDKNSTAVITVTERWEDEEGGVRETSWAQLREAVRQCAGALRASGLQQGEIVAGFVSNHVEALVAMLAAASIGAVWTGISPDTGVSAVLDRLAQIGPKVLFADNAMVYNGKEWSSTEKTAEIVAELRAAGGLELVVVIETLRGAEMGLAELKRGGQKTGRVETWDDFLTASSPDEPLRFEQLPPSHPLYILYSSGTTGLPKAIIHTAAGTLLQHKKEHFLHCSLTAASRMLYYTTTSWMMWHWSISALAVGASLVLYTGSPFRPHSHLSLPRLLSKFRVTHFGTSAAYLVALEANGVRPVEDPTLDLSALEAIYSTASPLPPSTFAFVYEAFPRTINLGSITGGTDIISLFGAPCPFLPVRAGEIQCAGLGMAVEVVDSASPEDDPRPVEPSGSPGDLVCVKPFPCQPLTFFGKGGDDKYRAAYFERFTTPKGPIWAHGDFVSLTPTRGLVMLGRSDGVLKPAGVRFGSAEIYNILTRYFAPTIADAVCIGRRRPALDADESVCLFLVMREGHRFVQGETDVEVKRVIRDRLSPRHVPAVVAECGPDGVPRTGNGKKIEVAVKQILSGLPVRTNASVANPEALEWFRTWAAEHP
ncbi:acetoacetate-CoA ligase [Cryphonectria parasitica EP155]|uniref:Acetoacetate-CoA ligase n=1 Tax=Cryphonectria parasitica (strain ATCC 38755 / EP155) TaxID=660469 RepID=A0A9P4YB94_CRYP1|nr:acetoacetate-CoA ligase [Cryphonectria parasitica EP155]KAF3769883.1 acetoacetate-CoA ligase [Cryphonectria parasitica EP155]